MTKGKECGTWFLSYLSEAGVFKLESDICWNTASGILKQSICDIPINSHVHFDIHNNEMNIKYLLPNCNPSVDVWEQGEDSDRNWCDPDDPHPELLTKTININISYTLKE